MKKKKSKKCLAALLSFLMLLPASSVSAAAYDSDYYASNAVSQVFGTNDTPDMAAAYSYSSLTAAQKSAYNKIKDACDSFLSSEVDLSTDFFQIIILESTLTSEEAIKTYDTFRSSNPQYYFLNENVKLYGEANSVSKMVLMVTEEYRKYSARASLGIIRQPSDVTANVGGTAEFSVIAKGAGLKYQWQSYDPTTKKTVTYPTGTASVFKYTDVKSTDNGLLFSCVITDSKGQKLTTSNAKLTVNAAALTNPALPNFTLTPGVNKMTLKWNAVTGARSYRVYYRLNGATKWSSRNTTGTTVTISDLTGGRKYDFLVLAYNGTFSKWTSTDIKVAAPTAGNKPVISSVTPGVNSAVLRWNAVSGATSYRVYYRVSGTSKWSYKNTTRNAMNLTGLTGGKTYEFVIRAYNGSAWTAFTSADIVKAAIKS